VSSCKKDEAFPSAVDYIDQITGTYTGTLEKASGLKATDPGTADVSYIEGSTVEIHCYGDAFDTTFRMDIYADNDNIMLCATGDNFESTYGHMQGDYHMDHHGENQTEWGHHMEDSHNAGDQHFGGFDMTNHSMNYTFKIENGNLIETIRFDGQLQ
jgi:hypothetical protein